MSEDGTSVNYESAKISKSFQEYIELVKNLKSISLRDLSVSEKKSFLINILMFNKTSSDRHSNLILFKKCFKLTFLGTIT